MNNGNLQARVAYKVSPNGDAIDINGQLTSVSGRRQAIAVMLGTPNPDNTKYEVELTFNPGQFIEGTPTTYVNLEICPISIFIIDKNYIVLHPGNIAEVLNLYSSFGWSYIGSVPFATVSPTTGAGGENTTATVSRTSTLGQGLLTFKDNTTNETKTVYVVNTDALGWILESGFWNDLRFWESTGIWNY